MKAVVVCALVLVAMVALVSCKCEDPAAKEAAKRYIDTRWFKKLDNHEVTSCEAPTVSGKEKTYKFDVQIKKAGKTHDCKGVVVKSNPVYPGVGDPYTGYKVENYGKTCDQYDYVEGFDTV